MPKSRIKARLRPHLKQRRTTRDLNLGGRLERTTVDFFAILDLVLRTSRSTPHSLGVTIPMVCLALRLSGTYQKKGALLGVHTM